VVAILYRANKNKKVQKTVDFIILVMLVIIVSELLIINKNIGFAEDNPSSPDTNVESSYDYDSDETANDENVIKEVDGVPVISQFPELPSGCESAAASMLAQWAGINVNKKEIAKFLPKGPLPRYRNGFLYGMSPEEAFIGDPFSNKGFGVYHGPVASVLNLYLEGNARDITGVSFQEVLKVIDGGRPVVVWATKDMALPYIYGSWYDKDGKRIEWIAPEHVFVLVGYTSKEVIVNDPYTGQRKLYPIKTFEDRWESMGRQAVTVSDRIPGKLVVTDITDLKNIKDKYGN
jgi:uncharacterized protein YvpB